MTPEQWRKVETVLAQALALPENEQADYVARACYGSPSLRAEVESLLAGRSAADDLLEIPVSLTGRQIGAYRLVRELGRGGMGAVYLAQRDDGQFQKTAAVKLLAAPLRSGELQRRFRDERQILAILEHPHIARLLDGGVTPDGLPFLVMEYVDGLPLSAYCEQHHLSVAQRLGLFQTICSAVHFAHQRLIVHRDIKPGNILVTPDGIPKLLDFGIAKILADTPDAGATVTAFGVHPMTPEYASPEQVCGSPITTATDVYSLGVLLFELLAGRRPFQLCGVSLEAAIRTIVHDDAPPPSRIRSSVPAELDAIVEKAMRKEPAGRYGSAEELAADIGCFLKGLPVAAHRGSRLYRARKLFARNRAAVSVAAAILVLICAGVWAIARQERIAERRFEQVRRLANSVIYELHDGIAMLPGSTAVRRQLITRATEYLNALAQEASGDTALQLELAAAYVRVADVLGGSGSSNLGDSEGALATAAKARSILEAVTSKEPSNTKALAQLARVHLQIASIQVFQRRFDDALTATNRGIEYWKRVQDIQASSEEAAAGMASAHFSLADTFNLARKPEEELRNRTKSLELYERLLTSHPEDLRYQRNTALALKTLGSRLVVVGRREEGLSRLLRALELDRERSATNPNNAQAKLDLTFDLSELGYYYSEAEPETALQYYSQSLALRRELAKLDPQDVRVQGRLAYAISRVASLHLKLEKYAVAIDGYQEAIAICKALLAKSSSDFASRDVLFRALSERGEAAEKLASFDRSHAARHRLHACDSYRASLAEFQELESRGVANAAERRVADDVRGRITACAKL